MRLSFIGIGDWEGVCWGEGCLGDGIGVGGEELEGRGEVVVCGDVRKGLRPRILVVCM